jgi:thiamine biosynthesis lipoprotein ApbE
VTDALATAFMLLSDEDIAQLCDGSPGLEAWIVDAPTTGSGAETRWLHFGSGAR